MNDRFDSRRGAPRLSPAAKWMLAIVGLLGANFAAMFVLIAKANYGASRVVPSYYDLAHRYESSQEQAANNRALGWTFEIGIANGIVALTATDGSGSPLVGARVDVMGTYRSSGEPIAGALIETKPGQYTGVIVATTPADESPHSSTARPHVPAVVARDTHSGNPGDPGDPGDPRDSGDLAKSLKTDESLKALENDRSSTNEAGVVDVSIAIERGGNRFVRAMTVVAQ